MAKSMGLFEYLGEMVTASAVGGLRDGTRTTFVDAETFDGDDLGSHRGMHFGTGRDAPPSTMRPTTTMGWT